MQWLSVFVAFIMGNLGERKDAGDATALVKIVHHSEMN